MKVINNLKNTYDCVPFRFHDEETKRKRCVSGWDLFRSDRARLRGIGGTPKDDAAAYASLSACEREKVLKRAQRWRTLPRVREAVVENGLFFREIHTIFTRL